MIFPGFFTMFRLLLLLACSWNAFPPFQVPPGQDQSYIRVWNILNCFKNYCYSVMNDKEKKRKEERKKKNAQNCFKQNLNLNKGLYPTFQINWSTGGSFWRIKPIETTSMSGSCVVVVIGQCFVHFVWMSAVAWLRFAKDCIGQGDLFSW